MDLKMLFRELSTALSINDYAAIGPTNGGAPWGNADPASRSIWIPQRRRVVNLSAAYAPTVYDTGTLFTIDTAITVTLPAVSAALAGIFYDFFIIADVSVTIAATANQMMTFNDLDADAIAFSTASEKIGASVTMICTGTAWLAQLHTEETQTVTVTT